MALYIPQFLQEGQQNPPYPLLGWVFINIPGMAP